MAPTPVKTYLVANSGLTPRTHMRLELDGKAVYWVNAESKMFKNPYITFHEGSSEGPVVAAVKLGLGRGFRVHVGDIGDVQPSHKETSQWPAVTASGLMTTSYTFTPTCPYGIEEVYSWKAASGPELGLSTKVLSSYNDLKLVALPPNHKNTIVSLGSGEGRIVAAYIRGFAMLAADRNATIQFFQPLEKSTELWALATLAGILEGTTAIRNEDNSNTIGVAQGWKPMPS